VIHHPETAGDPESLLSFWFGDDPNQFRFVWFERDAAHDEACGCFRRMLDSARAGRLDEWAGTSQGALALCILLDQFPRNLFREQPEAFAADAQARAIAREAISRGFDRALTPVQRMFLYLPFEHSEDLADQDESVRLFTALAEETGETGPESPLDYAHRHREIIRRFGRFPHRNAILGRENTADEQAYLGGPDAGFG
jgi:uncharacterized protein (DUF924 family)